MTTPSLRPLALALLLGAAPLAGCQTDTSPAPGLGDWVPAPANDPQITVLAEELRPWLGFQPSIVTRDPVLAIEVPVRNLAPRNYMIDYRFTYFDAQGRTIEPQLSWTPIPLESKQNIRLRGNALDQRAVNWKVEVRWAR